MSDLFDLSGHIACVTGASSGLGRRATEVLVAANARVVGIARRREALDELSTSLGKKFVGIDYDLASKGDLDYLASDVSKQFGAPDILIHAAGINPRQNADDLSELDWDITQNLNTKVPFFLSKAFVPAMKMKGWGRIINFASLQSFRAFPAGLAYGASKGAVAQLTRAMAEAWSPFGINVNAIGPGFFHTELTAAVFADPDRAKRNALQTCVGRNGELSDLDGPLLFLSSKASNYVTGQVLMVDGGYTAK